MNALRTDPIAMLDNSAKTYPAHHAGLALAGEEGGCTPACAPGCLLRTASCSPLPIWPVQRVADEAVANLPPQRVSGEAAHNLTAQPTQLVGRTDDLLRASQQLLLDKVRLLTLLGPAGVGKTRLALAVGDCTLEIFTNGVRFVDLAPIEDPALVMVTIGEALGVREARDQPLLPRLADCLLDQSILLILDNFEHVLAAAPDLARLLAVCPSIKLLVTSRAALRSRWEHVFRVRPLGVPPTATADLGVIVESAAVQLFVERAKAANSHFELNVDNAAHVSAVCRRLDGLPLAIELAAARVDLLPPHALLTRLDHRFDILVGGAGDLPDRQRSLRKALDYGFDLLDQDEQRLLMRLSVFAGSCTTEAATAIDPSGRPTIDGVDFGTLDGLDSLIHKSLLHHETTSDGPSRFRMLETVRQHALERLACSGDLETTRQRWLDYMLAFAEQGCQALLGPTQSTWLDLLENEHDNLQAALRACVDAGDAERGLALAAALWRFWYVRGLFAEGRAWFDEVLRLPWAVARTPTRARALGSAANLAYNQGDAVAARAFATESLSIQRELADKRGIADALEPLGRVAVRQRAFALAHELLEESLAVRREVGDAWGAASSLRCLGDLATEEGHYPAARSHYEASLLQWQTLGDTLNVASVLEGMAILAQSQGKTIRALRLAGASNAVRDRLHISCCSPAERVRIQSCLVVAKRDVGDDAAAQAVQEGRAMEVDEAIAYARTVDDPPTASTRPTSSYSLPRELDAHLAVLTHRERDVVAMLFRGASNRKIAEELVITERTAETHVCRILGKLGVASRAQVTALLTMHVKPGR